MDMGGKTIATLYGFWLSSCSWRVRAALHLKGIPYEEYSVDIARAREQLTEKYRAINPAQKVPALYIDGETFVESMAIIQYLDETRPNVALTPRTPILKARMRELCEIIVSGIQPLQNVGLKSHFENEAEYTRFSKYWTERGLMTLEKMLNGSAGNYCVGEQLTMADLCLVPQLYNAVTRHELDLKRYPILFKLYDSLLQEECFVCTHPKTVKRQKFSQ